MRIEVFQGPAAAGLWYWHFRARNGKITANNESFPSKANAMRAAKGVVKAIVKITGGTLEFQTKQAGKVTVIFI